MDDAIKLMATSIAAPIISLLVNRVFALLRKYIAKNDKKKEFIIDVIAAIMRYVLIIALNVLFFIQFEASKLLSELMFVLGVLTSFFIVRDYFNFSVHNLLRVVDKDKIEKDIETWTDQLGSCDREDRERRKVIVDKLKKLHYDLKKS